MFSIGDITAAHCYGQIVGSHKLILDEEERDWVVLVLESGRVARYSKNIMSSANVKVA